MTLSRRDFLAASALALPAQRLRLDHFMPGRADRMDWWREARFGLFLHWGLYSILAGTWREDERWAEWIRNNAEIPVDEYDHLAALWNPAEFDPDRWAEMAWGAGMRYVVLTTKHHDGFCLWDSAVGGFDVAATPGGRDICRELAAAFRRRGFRIGWYHSIMDWHHPDYLPRREWEQERRPAAGADYDRYERYLHAQVTELLTAYGPVDVLWFDGQWEGTWTHERAGRLHRLISRLAPDCLINDRINGAGTPEGGRLGDFGTPENTIPDTGVPGKDWESCITMNDNWGYKRQDGNWKSPRRLAEIVVETASKGGNLLLNVGPMADGLFPPPSVDRLRSLGAWMAVHGDFIRGSTASRFADVSRFRAVTQGNRAHLFVHDWRPGPLLLSNLTTRPTRARLVHHDATATDLVIQLWDDQPVVILPEVGEPSLLPCLTLEFDGPWSIGLAP